MLGAWRRAQQATVPVPTFRDTAAQPRMAAVLTGFAAPPATPTATRLAIAYVF